MSKSSGNSFILPDIEGLGIDPLAFRYLCMTARYTSRLNFTFSALKAAQRALLRLQNRMWGWSTAAPEGPANQGAVSEWHTRFMERVNDDLDIPGALALTWAVARSDMPDRVKLRIVEEYDKVLGLGLSDVVRAYQVPDDIVSLSQERAQLRRQGKYDEADALRRTITQAGFVIEDTASGPRVRPKSEWEKRQEQWSTVSSSAEVVSHIGAADEADISVGIVASNYLDDVRRCIQSVIRWLGDRPSEVVVVDNGSSDGTGEWLEEVASADPRIRVVHTDHILGEAAAKNIVLKQCRGKVVVLLETSVEVEGDIFGPLVELLDDDRNGMVGPYGLRTDDLHHFHEGEGEAGEVDAMQAYCVAFRRERLQDVGLMRETFRFYRNLDLDFSFQFKDKGCRIISDPELKVTLHEHRVWSELAEGERDELSRKNYRRFLDKWGDRADLLVSSQPKV